MGEPKSLCHTLGRLVLASRFPNETGSARLQQYSILQFIALMAELGKPTSAVDIALMWGSHPSGVRKICKTLIDRGLVEIFYEPGSCTSGRRSRLLRLRRDAMEAFTRVHIEVTGTPVQDWASR